jgi:hypothetical protein
LEVLGFGLLNPSYLRILPALQAVFSLAIICASRYNLTGKKLNADKTTEGTLGLLCVLKNID